MSQRWNKQTLQIGGGGAITIKDEGTTLTTDLASIDFVWAWVTATNTGSAVTVTIPTLITTWTFNADFWINTTNIFQKTVTVLNTNIKTASRPIVTLYNSGWRNIDELEFTDFTTWIFNVIDSTSFSVLVDDKAWAAEWIYNFSYSF